MASSRFGTSNLHQRDARSALFENYAGTGDQSRQRTSHTSSTASQGATPYRNSTEYSAFNGYPGPGRHDESNSFRAATPNSKGQYSDAVLSSLEDQNESQLAGMSAKVKMLKDITVAIGDEIKASTTLADSMNDTFDNTRVRLRGTMNRMLRMAEKTGIGWRAWLLFFVLVWAIFVYVWLF